MKRDWSRVKGALQVVAAVAVAANFVWMVNMIVCEGYGRCIGWW